MNMYTTPGPWIVTTNMLNINGKAFENAITVQKAESEKLYLVAICGQDNSDQAGEAFANAALISIAPEMLEALIAIQEAAQMDILDAESIEKMISDVFAKLANEAEVNS